jgi:hypothetical protein
MPENHLDVKAVDINQMTRSTPYSRLDSVKYPRWIDEES